MSNHKHLWPYLVFATLNLPFIPWLWNRVVDLGSFGAVWDEIARNPGACCVVVFVWWFGFFLMVWIGTGIKRGFL